ncbi:MAG: hypothetical protein Q8K18_19475 [Burkholderiales bacterium]|nr:hypothetical protein [Burkholderiales bacterium]
MADAARVICGSDALAERGKGVRRTPDGEFPDHSKLYLICATHGATCEPDSGCCVLGPCRGKSLLALPVVERGGAVPPRYRK